MTLVRCVLLVVGVVAGGSGWVMFGECFGRPGRPPVEDLHVPQPTISADGVSARFSLCDGLVRADCVVDGDTFWFRGEKVRIADIDAPEISEPGCPAERQAGELARDRLLAMLNEGRFRLTAGGRDEDSYGRKLRVVSRSGRSLGERLVAESLARRWNRPDFGWCGEAGARIGAER